jgi:hypothetical protein
VDLGTWFDVTNRERPAGYFAAALLFVHHMAIDLDFTSESRVKCQRLGRSWGSATACVENTGDYIGPPVGVGQSSCVAPGRVRIHFGEFSA